MGDDQDFEFFSNTGLDRETNSASNELFHDEFSTDIDNLLGRKLIFTSSKTIDGCKWPQKDRNVSW